MFYLFPLFGYLLGSVPFGLLITRFAKAGDLRQIGSGNIGATNVLRTGHKGLAFVTLICDMVKGWLPVYLSFMSGDPMVTLATALACVLGHMYPVWLKFKGGKGVAVGFGVFLALMPLGALIMLAVWIGTAFVFGYSSLAAMAATAAAPILSIFFFDDVRIILFSLIVAALVVWKHRANLKRLLNGEESKISFKKKG